jgi:hypothetical protein
MDNAVLYFSARAVHSGLKVKASISGSASLASTHACRTRCARFCCISRSAVLSLPCSAFNSRHTSCASLRKDCEVDLQMVYAPAVCHARSGSCTCPAFTECTIRCTGLPVQTTALQSDVGLIALCAKHHRPPTTAIDLHSQN